MDFLSSLAKGGSGDDAKKPSGGEEKSSTAEIMADAKVVAEAARAQYNKQPEKCDKSKAAESAADLLDAASDYGKLDETKGVGKYVDQAEDYLRQYSGPKPTAGAEKPAAKPAGEEKGESGGGYGDLMKAAGGLFK